MSKEFLPTLFDSFSRERNTTVGKVAGTGLGMAIVKKYVDLMGGSIEVESQPGKGTVFTVMLIYKKAFDAGMDDTLQNRLISKSWKRSFFLY